MTGTTLTHTTPLCAFFYVRSLFIHSFATFRSHCIMWQLRYKSHLAFFAQISLYSTQTYYFNRLYFHFIYFHLFCLLIISFSFFFISCISSFTYIFVFLFNYLFTHLFYFILYYSILFYSLAQSARQSQSVRTH